MTIAGLPATLNREDLEILEGLRREIRDSLSRTKTEIDREIRSYPTPIPRCDAQFNHLHERRARISRELDRLGELTDGRRDWVATIERFIGSAPYTDEPAERELRSKVKARLAALGERGRE